MKKVTISVKNLVKKYKIYDDPKDRYREVVSNGKKIYSKEHYALDDISFDVSEGEILGIIGVNGSGKSTLLKIITGVLQPSSGEVKVNGKISALLELGAGFNPEYTGIENIYFNGMVMGFSRKEMDEKLQEIIEFADIGEFINQPVKTYSSGMLVRLAYSVAISIEPDILIVDEALAVGDIYFQMKSMSKMEELFRKGKTVIFVSHDTASVRSLCNTAIYLHKGKIVAKGSAKEVVDFYEENARKTMSESTGGSESDSVKSIDCQLFEDVSEQKFLYSEEYMKRVALSREGDGGAMVCGLEFLDADYQPAHLVKFNQKCIVRMHIQFNEDCKITVGYHIRDSKNTPVLGSNTLLEEIGEIEGCKGERIIVEFRTRLPLRDGKYNIMTVLSTSVYLNRTVEFKDITKDGLYFDVLENEPYRVWNTVKLPNEVSIKRVKE